VSAEAYYGTYHGHEPTHLAVVLRAMREADHPHSIWLAGDSSLDNKFWFASTSEALNGYETVLTPPTMKKVGFPLGGGRAGERRLPCGPGFGNQPWTPPLF
jgi:hypothetical protein